MNVTECRLVQSRANFFFFSMAAQKNTQTDKQNKYNQIKNEIAISPGMFLMGSDDYADKNPTDLGNTPPGVSG